MAGGLAGYTSSHWDWSVAALAVGVAAALLVTILLWMSLMWCNTRLRKPRTSMDGFGMVRDLDECLVCMRLS